MSTHYNAFISYKHADLDNKVAAMIEKDLEHYHIPARIQKKTGIKKIERIFRDTDELPITSDLSATIEEALANSDFLIVLCSKNTCLSTWVEREIQLFLQNHSRDNILTVVADGEPNEVIPQVLLSRDVQVTDVNGEIRTVTEKVEPLACDYRLQRKDVKATEVPRLVSAMIGCSYNELMDRQRQYKMKRLTAIFAAAMALFIGFGAYMIYSNHRIHENYIEALTNQSKFLANESEKYMNDEQRLKALWLALAALPNEDNPDRPVIPEAVKAITKATRAYVANDGSANITATWNYTMPDTITDFQMSFDGSACAAIDASFNVRVWNHGSHELVYEYNSVDNGARHIEFLDKDILMITGYQFVMAINTYDGSEMWKHEKLSDEWVSNAIGDDFQVMEDGTVMVSTDSDGLYKLDIMTGEIVDIYTIPTENELYKSVAFTGFQFSKDGSKLSFFTSIGERAPNCLVVCDMESGDLTYVDCAAEGYLPDGYYFLKTKWIGNDTIMFATTKDWTETNYTYENKNIISTNKLGIFCINADDLTLRWQDVFAENSFAYDSEFTIIDKDNGVLFYAGNIISIWDQTTGELLKSYNTNSIITNMQWLSAEADYPMFFTNDGGYIDLNSSDEAYKLLPNDDSLIISYYFTDDIDKAIANRGVYVHKEDSNELIFYSVQAYDDDIHFIKNSPVYLAYDSNIMFASSEEYLSVFSSNDGKANVSTFDLNSMRYLSMTELGNEDDIYAYEVLGYDNGRTYLTDYSRDEFDLVEIDNATGEITRTKLSDATYICNAVMKNGKIFYYTCDVLSDPSLFCYDLKRKVANGYGVDNEGYSRNVIEYDDENDVVFCGGDVDQLLNLKGKEKKAKVFKHDGDWDETVRAIIDPEGKKVITTDNHMIEIFDFDGNSLLRISCIEVEVQGMDIFSKDDKSPKELLVMYDNGDLYRYNYETGEFIAKTSLENVSRYAQEAVFYHDEEKNLLFVQGCMVTHMIELDSWTELATIDGGMGFNSANDAFLVMSEDGDFEKKVGFYRRYSTEQLIEKGKKLLEGTEISEEFKQQYGL
ncbi:MTH538 TIR-like domain [Butyrivibrio sp. INlla18]|uniref:toll/interleukin-1 receptor domain-containing protein n=1 Tax=Butyrivibrio sp. INlla18 TaxID=1520806 RepID=UPI000882815D|nr:toll/interleukin-1 receptor domain-containing protein [Butyrivibrio sp. INlla18]SDA62147.1 MTH538 TIR-like domain [Butyrivibrio sp. INlla18]